MNSFAILRIPITIVLIAMALISGVVVKNDLVADWKNEQANQNVYFSAPNCFQQSDRVVYNYSLPPCTYQTETVTDKPRESFHKRDGTEGFHYSVTLRDSAGRTTTYPGYYEDNWNAIRIGDAVSVQRWKNQVEQITDGDNRQSVYTFNMPNGLGFRTALVALLFSCCLLIFMYGGRHRYSYW